MPGHEDPKGIIKYDKEGKAYLEIVKEVIEEKPLETIVEEIKPTKKSKKK